MYMNMVHFQGNVPEFNVRYSTRNCVNSSLHNTVRKDNLEIII